MHSRVGLSCVNSQGNEISNLTDTCLSMVAFLVLVYINSCFLSHCALQTIPLCSSLQRCEITTKAFQMAPTHLMSGSLTEAFTFKKLVTLFTSAWTLALSALSWPDIRHLKYGMSWWCCSFIKLPKVFTVVCLLHTDVSLLRATWCGLHLCDSLLHGGTMSQLLPHRNILTAWPWHCTLSYVWYFWNDKTEHIECDWQNNSTSVTCCSDCQGLYWSFSLTVLTFTLSCFRKPYRHFCPTFAILL